MRQGFGSLFAKKFFLRTGKEYNRHVALGKRVHTQRIPLKSQTEPETKGDLDNQIPSAVVPLRVEL
jgi:hypothetical protein